MRDNAETRNELQKRISAGSAAVGALRLLDPKFEKVQEIYLAELVDAVNGGKGQETVYQLACRMAALDDVYEELRKDAVTGARAQQTATELEG